VVALLLLVVSAGCLSGAAGPGADTTNSPSGDGVGAAGGEIPVTVTEVVDGDTIKIEYANGTRDTVRLLGVDTPEVLAENTPAEFEGVPETTAGERCLRRAGETASAYATDRLAGESVTLVFDSESERRGYYGRLLAYVYVDGESFNHALLQAGHARVYDSEFTERKRYDRTAAAARADRRGLWSCVDAAGDTTATPDSSITDGPLVLAGSNYDAAGNDNENLNDEYVTFGNEGSDPLDVSGWIVADEAGHTYRFPDGTVIEPGATVTLRTGSGTDTAATYYWGRSGAVWNNDGDVVIVRDATGATVLREPY
jgi:micrococcal nuclease